MKGNSGKKVSGGLFRGLGSFLLILFAFFLVFKAGELASSWILSLFSALQEALVPAGSSAFREYLWKAIGEGLVAFLAFVIPYIIPFYILFGFLENSKTLERAGALTSGLMEKIGLERDALTPILLGYGCSVNSCLSCYRIKNEGRRFRTALVATLLPCSARSTVILGLVGAFLGLGWVIGIYAFNLAFALLFAFFLSKAFPDKGPSSGKREKILPPPCLTRRGTGNVWMESLQNFWEFFHSALPIVVLANFAVATLDYIGVLGKMTSILAPFTTGVLGLPEIAIVALIWGFLRGELTLVVLASSIGTASIGTVLSNTQIVVFTLVSVFYVPCVSALSALKKEFGLGKAAIVGFVQTAIAFGIGALAFRLLPLLGI